MVVEMKSTNQTRLFSLSLQHQTYSICTRNLCLKTILHWSNICCSAKNMKPSDWMVQLAFEAICCSRDGICFDRRVLFRLKPLVGSKIFNSRDRTFLDANSELNIPQLLNCECWSKHLIFFL